jgi:hypothetical protein
MTNLTFCIDSGDIRVFHVREELYVERGVMGMPHLTQEIRTRHFTPQDSIIPTFAAAYTGLITQINTYDLGSQ